MSAPQHKSDDRSDMMSEVQVGDHIGFERLVICKTRGVKGRVPGEHAHENCNDVYLKSHDSSV